MRKNERGTHRSRALIVIVMAGSCFVVAAGNSNQEVRAKTQELPPEQYAQLREQVFADARAHLSPKLKNPQISNNGLQPDVLKELKEQRQYFEAHRSLISLQSSRAIVTATSRAREVNLHPQLLDQPALPVAESPKLTPASTVCNQPAIRSVNGKFSGVVFTPQTPDNSYKIEGCFFGNVRGQLQLEPHPPVFGQSALPITLHVENFVSAWSDNEIHAHVDPHLSGISDSPVTLVVYPGRGKRVELPGCLFVAARGEPQLLSVIPSSWIELQASTVHGRSIRQLEYVSPLTKGSDAPRDAAATSAFVVRSDQENFGAGNDTYDFSNLNPGWVVDSVQLQTYAVACPGDVTYAQSIGRWSTTWSQKSFTVGWQDDLCESYIPPSFSFNLSFSQYAAKVWVLGPVGTQPVSNGLLK